MIFVIRVQCDTYWVSRTATYTVEAATSRTTGQQQNRTEEPRTGDCNHDTDDIDLGQLITKDDSRDRDRGYFFENPSDR